MRQLSLEETKQCILQTLLCFDDFCKKNKITWWLCGGTLLGAVRHKGFIPWDDDVDIMLPRQEYERLCVVFPKEGRYQFLNSGNTKNFPYPFGKVVDTYTIKDEEIRRKFLRIGIDIDVFPIDNLPANDKECMAYFREIGKLGRKLEGMKILYGSGKTIKSTILKNGYILWRRSLETLRMCSFEKKQKQFIELTQKYNKQECDFWGITSISHYGIKERNHKKGYDKTVFVEFEGHLFPAPQCYDTYLSQLYGKDYMQLPPKEKQITHHAFKSWWK